MNVLSGRWVLSVVRMRVNMRSMVPRMAASAGTKQPIWDMYAIRPAGARTRCVHTGGREPFGGGDVHRVLGQAPPRCNPGVCSLITPHGMLLRLRRCTDHFQVHALSAEVCPSNDGHRAGLRVGRQLRRHCRDSRCGGVELQTQCRARGGKMRAGVGKGACQRTATSFGTNGCTMIS